MNDLAKGCATIAAGLFLFLCLIGIRTVAPGEAAIVVRGGSVIGDIRKEGLYIEPLSGGNWYDLKTTLVQDKFDAGSKEAQYVYVDAAFTYSLKEDQLKDLFRNVGSQDDLKNKIIVPTLKDVVKLATAQYSANEILPKQGEFRSKVKELLGERLDQTYLKIEDIQITNIDFSDEYNKAIEAKQKAEQETAKKKFELQQAQIDADKKVTEAKGAAEAQRLQQQTLTEPILNKLWLDKWDGHLPQYVGSDIPLYMPTK